MSSRSSPSPSGPSGVCALIDLKGPQNIRIWDHFLFVELDAENLADYLFEGAMPEPPPQNHSLALDNRHEVWRMNRAKAMRILCSTLKNNEEAVYHLLRGGWGMSSCKDPAELWKLVWRVFKPTS